jgi:hypothetical protein
MYRKDETPTPLTMAVLCACALLATSAYAQEKKPDAATPGPNTESAAAKEAMAEHQGIWKWVVPPVKMHGMFDDHDPIGLVAGKLIPADCAFNWTDPDTHELYCFTTATSLVFFLDSPQTYLAEAERNWRSLKGRSAKAR